MKPVRAWLLGLGLLAGLARAQETGEMTVRLPQGVAPTWQAVPQGETAGDRGAQILYPAPNAGGLIAAILTHSLIVNGSRESERRAKLEQAELTLQPLRGVIKAHLEGSALLARAQAHLMERVAPDAMPRWVEVVPHYSVQADHRALSLEALVRLPAQNAGGTKSLERAIRVVSAPRFDADPTAHWLSSEGEPLRNEASRMLAHAVEIAIVHGQRPPAETAARTQRYLFGSETLMERGQMLKQGCDRVLLFTLREHWMSVPTIASADKPCDLAYHLDAR